MCTRNGCDFVLKIIPYWYSARSHRRSHFHLTFYLHMFVCLFCFVASLLSCATFRGALLSKPMEMVWVSFKIQLLVNNFFASIINRKNGSLTLPYGSCICCFPEALTGICTIKLAPPWGIRNVFLLLLLLLLFCFVLFFCLKNKF